MTDTFFISNINIPNDSKGQTMHLKSSQIKILIVDDDEDDFFILSEYIKNISGHSFAIDWSFQYQEALDQMCEGNYDLYFVDYRLGLKTGLELLQDAMNRFCEEPIILLTGRGNQKIDMQAMEAGAIDYLIKSDLTTEKLERCIRYSLERARSVKALKKNEKKFRNMFEKSKDAVFIADQNFLFKDVNKAISELLIYDKEEILQLTIYDLLANKQQISFIKKELEATGEIDDLELELITKKNEKIICLLSATKETDEINQNHIQGIIHDITDLKKAERANLQAEKLNTANRLIQILAHEVRGPLNNISLSVEGINSENDFENAKPYLEIISRNTTRINDLISELLQSSRPSEMTMQQIDLRDIIDQTLHIASDRMTLKKIKASHSYLKKPAYISGDADKLKIAFLNIIINAIEAINHEKGKLNIAIEDADEDYTVLVSDNGSGISEENVSRLFEPYFTSKKNGLGLGLAATLSILQSHKSVVDVKTKVGEGTTFLLSFPKS